MIEYMFKVWFTFEGKCDESTRRNKFLKIVDEVQFDIDETDTSSISIIEHAETKEKISTSVNSKIGRSFLSRHLFEEVQDNNIYRMYIPWAIAERVSEYPLENRIDGTITYRSKDYGYYSHLKPSYRTRDSLGDVSFDVANRDILRNPHCEVAFRECFSSSVNVIKPDTAIICSPDEYVDACFYEIYHHSPKFLIMDLLAFCLELCRFSHNDSISKLDFDTDCYIHNFKALQSPKAIKQINDLVSSSTYALRHPFDTYSSNDSNMLVVAILFNNITSILNLAEIITPEQISFLLGGIPDLEVIFCNDEGIHLSNTNKKHPEDFWFFFAKNVLSYLKCL